MTEFTNALSGQLNSQWSSNLSSEIRVAYKYYRRGQDAFYGPDYAQMAVCLDPTSSATLYPNSAATLCNSGTPIISIGPDTPRQANVFHNRQLTINSNLQMKAGEHTFKLEADHFHSSLYNLFVFGGGSVTAGSTGGGSGAYYFDSLADFSARSANEFVLTTTTTGNQNFLNRYSALYPGITNTATLNGRSKLQPRVGFNWAATPELRISGGIGLFSGGLSDVFLSNNYSNSGAAINATGASITSIDILRTGGTAATPTCTDKNSGALVSTAVCTAALTSVAGGAVPQAVIDYVKANASVAANALTNSLDPNFKLPAQWKYNLSANWKPHFGDSALASGWTFRADALYSKAQQAIRWIDLRAQPLVTAGVVQLAT